MGRRCHQQQCCFLGARRSKPSDGFQMERKSIGLVPRWFVILTGSAVFASEGGVSCELLYVHLYVHLVQGDKRGLLLVKAHWLCRRELWRPHSIHYGIRLCLTGHAPRHGPSFTCLAARMPFVRKCGTVKNIDHKIAELLWTQFRVRSSLFGALPVHPWFFPIHSISGDGACGKY